MSDQKWTAAQMPDLSGKIIVVTGGNSGIGYEAASEFARRGAVTVLACRNLEKARAAQSRIEEETGASGVSVMQLNLASLDSVREFAENYQQRHAHLDVLVNNAGVMATPYATTEDGLEQQMGINHFGHFALTGLLKDRLIATPGSRVVNVSSGAHKAGKMDFDNLLFENGRDYSRIGAYARSKLANLLFTYELQRRFEAAGSDSKALAAHPGGSRTNLAEHFMDRWYARILLSLFSLTMQSAAMGALPTLRAAVDPGVKGGEYFGPDGLMEQRGHPVEVESIPAAREPGAAERLWQISEDLTGVRWSGQTVA